MNRFIFLICLSYFPQTLLAGGSFFSSRTEQNFRWMVASGMQIPAENLTGSVTTDLRVGSRLVPFRIVSVSGEIRAAGVALSPASDSLLDWYQNRLSDLLAEWIRSGPVEAKAMVMSEKIGIQMTRFTGLTSADWIDLALAASGSDRLDILHSRSAVSFIFSGIRVTVPAREDLVTGRTREELDNRLARSLATPQSVSISPFCSLGQASREKGEEWLPGFYSDRFGLQTAAGFSPVWDPAAPDASLRTAFTSGAGQLASKTITLSHHTYGNQTSVYSLPAERLIKNLSAGYQIFTGLESPAGADSNWTVTVLAVHPQFAHQHLLVISAPLAGFFSKTGLVLQAELFTFIRTDNLKSLVSGYKDKKPGYRILR
ncbi:MAG: hypothetical protein L6Q77_13935 [Bacteroidetes bacterium]|nr:hypothetical protein [Bacteroidota bacterium]